MSALIGELAEHVSQRPALQLFVPRDNMTERRMVLLQWFIMPFVLAGCVFPFPKEGELGTHPVYAAIIMLIHPLAYFAAILIARDPSRTLLRNFAFTATDITTATFVFYATAARPGYAQVLLFCAVALAATRYAPVQAFGITTLIGFLLLTAALLPLKVGVPTLASEILALYALTYVIGLLSQAERAVSVAAVENGMLAEKVLDRNRELNVLNRLSHVLSSQSTEEEVLRHGIAGIAEALSLEDIRAYDVQNETLKLRITGLLIGSETDETRWHAQAAEAMMRREMIVDAKQVSTLDNVASDHSHCISIPLVVNDGVRGVIQAFLHHDSSETVGEALELFCQEVAVALENALLRGATHRSAVLQEKNRIAQELHDTVLQILFSTGLWLQWSIDHLPEESPLHEALAEARRLSVRAGEELRGAIFTLSSDIAEIGLVAAVNRLVEDQSRKGPWSVSVLVNGEPPVMPVLVQNVAHRVVREALMNAYKHARASEVFVSLRFQETRLVVTVQDNGVGMSEDAIAAYRQSSDHFGLRSVAEQLGGLGGTLAIYSDVEEQGTTVKAIIPLEQVNEEAA